MWAFGCTSLGWPSCVQLHILSDHPCKTDLKWFWIVPVIKQYLPAPFRSHMNAFYPLFSETTDMYSIGLYVSNILDFPHKMVNFRGLEWEVIYGPMLMSKLVHLAKMIKYAENTLCVLSYFEINSMEFLKENRKSCKNIFQYCRFRRNLIRHSTSEPTSLCASSRSYAWKTPFGPLATHTPVWTFSDKFRNWAIIII